MSSTEQGSDISFSGHHIAAPANTGSNSSPDDSIHAILDGDAGMCDDRKSWSVVSDRGVASTADRGRIKSVMDNVARRKTINTRSKSRSTPSPSAAAEDLKSQLARAQAQLRQHSDDTRRMASEMGQEREKSCRLEVMYSELKYQTCAEFTAYQNDVHQRIEQICAQNDDVKDAVMSNDDGMLREIEYVTNQRNNMRDAARHIFVRGEEMTRGYEQLAENYHASELQSQRMMQTLHSELQEAMKIAHRERDATSFANQVSQESLLKSEELNELRKELQSRSLELQSRNAIISNAATEVMEARSQSLALEVKQNHEAVVMRQNARQEERNAMEKLLRTEDMLYRSKEEVMVYENIANRLATEKKDLVHLEQSIANERDSLKISGMNSIALPASPSALNNERIAYLNDQVSLKEKMIHDLHSALQDVTRQHHETCHLLDKERDKNMALMVKSSSPKNGSDEAYWNEKIDDLKNQARESNERRLKEILRVRIERDEESERFRNEIGEIRDQLEEEEEMNARFRDEVSELDDWNDQLAEHLRLEEEQSASHDAAPREQHSEGHQALQLQLPTSQPQSSNMGLIPYGSNFGDIGMMRGPATKELDKLANINWPTISNLLVWKSDLIQNVITASGDRDTNTWKEWIGKAMVEKPDMNELRSSGGMRFEQIDHKLANALTKCIENGGDSAKEVSYRLRNLKLERGKTNDLVLGREILALVLGGFLTSRQDRTMFNASNLHTMKYPGDHALDRFWNLWLEIQNNIASEDKQSDRTLRDCLWRKIQHSKLMQLDMMLYDAASEGDSIKTLKWLESRIVRHINKQIEAKNLNKWDKYLGSLTAAKPSAAAPKEDGDGDATSPNHSGSPRRRKKKSEGTKDDSPSKAAPIIANPPQKHHDKTKKERPRSRPTTPKVENKDKPCYFFSRRRIALRGMIVHSVTLRQSMRHGKPSKRKEKHFVRGSRVAAPVREVVRADRIMTRRKLEDLLRRARRQAIVSYGPSMASVNMIRNATTAMMKQ